MKPIKLEIEGINSYSTKQSIDFKQLTSRGIFGIFGKTGSGKSTILDAITLALYGNIARGSKEFVNSSVDKGTVDYEFELGLGENMNSYKVSRRFKKNKNKASCVSDYVRLMKKNPLGEYEIIADKVKDVNEEIKNIIGLEEDDFLRSVVLPQGKFSEFLTISGKDRRNMLERIFNLEEYGSNLSVKLRNRKAITQEEGKILEAQISEYPNINEEEEKKLEEEFNNLIAQGEEKGGIVKKAKEEFEEKKKVYELCQEKEKYTKVFKELEEKKDEYEGLEKKLEASKRADLVILEVERLEKIAKEGLRLKQEESRLLDTKKTLEKEVARLREGYEEVVKKKEDSDRLIPVQERIANLVRLRKKVGENKANLELNSKEEEVIKANEKTSREELARIEKNLEELKKEAKDLEKLLEEGRVELGYKEAVQKGLLVFRESHGKTAICKKAEEESLELEKEIKKLENKLFAKMDVLGKKDEEIGNIIELISKQQLVEVISDEDLELLVNRISHIEKSLKELQEKYSSLEEIEARLKDRKEELEKVEKKVLELDRMNDARSIEILSAKIKEHWKHSFKSGDECPVCKNKVEEMDFSSIGEGAYSEYKQALDEENLKREALEKKLTELGIKKEVLQASIKDIEATFENIADFSLEKLRKRGEELVGERDRQRGIRNEKTKNLESLKSKREEADREKLEISKEVSSLESTLKAKKEELKKIGIRIGENLSEKKLLDEELKEIMQKYKIEDMEKEEQILKQAEEEYERNLLKERNLKVETEAVLNSLNEEKTVLNELRLALGVCKNNEENYKKVLKEAEEEESEIMEKVDLEEVYRILEESVEVDKLETRIQEHIEKVKLAYEELKKRLAEGEKNAEANKIAYSEASKEVAINEKQEKEQNLLVESRLVENKFNSKEEARLAFMEDSLQEEMLKKLEEYRKKVDENNLRLKDITDKLGEKSITHEEISKSMQELEKLEEELKVMRDEYVQKKYQLKEMRENLKKVGEIGKKIRENTKKLDTILSLEKVLKGNKFVEYLSRIYLKNIVFDASKRLAAITNGRYALEIDSDYSFVISDSFNGGLRRSAHTLSGGEIFLTSLALALALSSQIQLKGAAPLQFFFLDEGFGTLDNDLLDTVMKSLEKLHSNTMSVGIISHVEELKTRIPMKLVVEMDENGSNAKIEVS